MDEGETEDELVAAFKAAHADAKRLDAELAAARARRRDAGQKLHTRFGRGTSWLAHLIGVRPQAVDSLLKYHQRKKRET
ncbi:LuxR family transcriptional regulator [Nocardia sp. NPDC052566]|uniref:LuxR family transcriptional regulator n=1 Tax=Nocardia sp. NPDC052566 TaxID=3364330 RepID=UPI0037C68761